MAEQMYHTVGGGYKTLHQMCDEEGRWDEFHGGNYYEGYLRKLRFVEPEHPSIPDLEKLVSARVA